MSTSTNLMSYRRWQILANNRAFWVLILVLLLVMSLRSAAVEFTVADVLQADEAQPRTAQPGAVQPSAVQPSAVQPSAPPQRITHSEDAFTRAWHDLQTLSDDAMQGRKTAAAGAELARGYLRQRFAELRLQGQPYDLPFDYGVGFSERRGINLVGYRQGCGRPEFYIIVTAHYDHLGGAGRRIMNGADDNASGVAGLLYLAALTEQRCPFYSIIFLATDAEEAGLHGAKAFVNAPPVALTQVVLNINLDMIGRGERRNTLVVAGTKKRPFLQGITELRRSDVRLVAAHDSKQLMRGQTNVDWPNASDHAPFRKAGIPYLYFGVDVHPHYHTPEDDWSRINPKFYQEALLWIADVFWWVQQIPPEQWRPAQASTR